MHLPSFVVPQRDRSFYANFYCRPPSEIEIIEKSSTTKPFNIRTISESPITLIPICDAISNGTSGCFSSSECSSSSESTSSYTRRRRTTAPTIQERLNTYESACHRQRVLQLSAASSKPNPQLCSRRSPPSLVNSLKPIQRQAEQINSASMEKLNTPEIDQTRLIVKNQTKDKKSSTSRTNEPTKQLDSSKRYLSKSTSQLCETTLMKSSDEQDSLASSSRNILDIIQEELVRFPSNSNFSFVLNSLNRRMNEYRLFIFNFQSEIRRTDDDLKNMFLSIYGKIQNIQQLKLGPVSQQKYQRYNSHYHDRPSRSIVHSCYSSNSDIRRLSCTHLHHTRKYSLHTVSALRHRINHARASSTADNDSYVDTDSSSSLSDSGTCSSPVYHGPCVDD